MLRHTCDYDTYSGLWFQPTGLPDHVKIPVPPIILERIQNNRHEKENNSTTNHNDYTIHTDDDNIEESGIILI